MMVKILEEAGYWSALRAMSYSFKDRATPVDEWWDGHRDRAVKRAGKLAGMWGGHNDFMKQIMVWIDIEAPRYWWSEMDTYHFVWKNSESTMHTLSKRDATIDDFEVGTHQSLINAFNTLKSTNPKVDVLKANLPDGYLQRRLCTTNYMALRNIINQRTDHRLPQWQTFCKEVVKQCQHPELLL